MYLPAAAHEGVKEAEWVLVRAANGCVGAKDDFRHAVLQDAAFEVHAGVTKDLVGPD